ncbi:helix-turn-helix domain-containing protein [Kitasatospora sp. NPDC051984]|uniref:helix-turn-helix domain-containing protein n=1 Tax=Kitasatospora sp. NPDC051984 TaxID=3364059 RepID=UPI0037CA9FEC
MLAQPSFGRRLKQLRQQQGKSQAELTGPGMSAAYLSRLESGARPPTERAVALLAERLKVSVDAFSTVDPSDIIDVLATVLTSASADSGLAQARLESALAHAADADAGLRWQAHAQLAKLLIAKGEREAAYASLTTLVELADELGQAVLQVYSRLQLARCLRDLGRLEDARVAALEGRRVGLDASLSGPDVVRCQLLLAAVVAELGDLTEALRLSSEACENLGPERGPLAAEALWTMATVSTRLGRHAQSAALLDRAMAELDSRDDLTLWMRLRLAAAALALQALPPRLEQAEQHLTTVRPALDLVGSTKHEQEYTFLQAQLAYARGEYGVAAELSDRARAGLGHLNFRDRVRLEMLHEQIRIRRGDATAAVRLRNLAAEAQLQGMLDLAAEVWRAAAETTAEPAGADPAAGAPVSSPHG